MKKCECKARKQVQKHMVARGLVGPAFVCRILLQEPGKMLKTWVSGTHMSKLRAESEAAKNPETGGLFSGNGAGAVAKLPIQKG